MAKKATKTTLFNKNHITITKDSNVKNDYPYVNVRSVYTSDSDYSNRVKKIIRCKSPLGFYYDKTTYVNKHNKSSSTQIIEVYGANENYVITYITHYNQNSIGTDLRPWEVCEGEKSMPEHFIFALKDIVDKILVFVEENKLKIKEHHFFDKSENQDVKWLKDILYRDLFGNTKGIRFQTDKEKILSHGFDLKTSFRK